MHTHLRIATLLTAITLILTGCNASDPTATSAPAPPKAALSMSPAAAAKALRNSRTAELGTWAMLHQLGVEVRTRGGRVVMPGIGPQQQRVVVLDSQISSLARGAAQPGITTDTFARRMSAAGARQSAGAIVSAFTSGFARNPGLASARLASAMKIDLNDPDERLTPIEEWLLTLDGFTPASTTNNSSPVDSSDPQRGWGAGSSSGQLSSLPDPTTLLQIQQLAMGVELLVTPSSLDIRTGDGAPGDEAEITHALNVRALGPIITNDGSLITPIGSGPLAGFPVNVQVTGAEFLEHASAASGGVPLLGQPIVTDSSGMAAIKLAAGIDPGTPQDTDKIATAVISSSVSTADALARSYLLPPWAISYLASLPPQTSMTIAMVHWHDSREQQPDVIPDGEWQGSAPLTGSLTKANIEVEFTGSAEFTFTVSGGQVTDGTLTASITGTGAIAGRSVDASGTAQLSLSGSASNIQGSGSTSVSVNVAGTTQGTTFPASFSFTPRRISCTTLTGDLLLEPRQRASAAGFAATQSGVFTAQRTDNNKNC